LEISLSLKPNHHKQILHSKICETLSTTSEVKVNCKTDLATVRTYLEAVVKVKDFFKEMCKADSNLSFHVRFLVFQLLDFILFPLHREFVLSLALTTPDLCNGGLKGLNLAENKRNGKD
jgi:hypothetical protein